MGTRHESGYSADVEAFFVTAGKRIRVAKTSHVELSIAESCELPPGTEGDLLIIVEGNARSQRVLLPEGVEPGQTRVKYEVAAPF
ncbi:MAG TPA: hypothetical protein VGN42_05290 [Pirellulales bacterium]|nr:hypothetical protein [Pirellulales bacterium]